MSAWQKAHGFVVTTCAVAFVVSVVAHYAGWSLSNGVLLVFGAVVAAAVTPRY